MALNPSLNSSLDSSTLNSSTIESLQTIPDVLKDNGVIAYPTEAVWGLGCDPWNEKAVMKLLNIKKRPVEKGVILIAASEEQVLPLLENLSQEQRAKLSASWPGPYTWLLPDPNQWTPDWIRGQFSTVAVRVSNHPVVKGLCEKAGKPLVSTSANLAGEAPLMTQEAVSKQLGNQLDLIVAGDTGARNEPSEIRDLQSGQLIRAG
ncbi:threonylcarbamoyl-AMP synthase [Endozoicomonas sp. OPT23]|uniref:L-threonylcarbamoyladenylate synthase n=1 Tax=Endozoicomonas sp. OPT23 TaxID=2072845 RepID=UPI00129B0A0E|nr:L-threonylcarbamoyladenylate synthase [Endozoicomonas sp. OPT23]MRI33369.1 threonylcarbamoyl-AMP synthase [Endozoicomonas sp. OPT23]